MAHIAFKTYTEEHGGRVLLLFLLFLLALYQFYSAGFGAFAIVCLLPVMALFVIAAFHYRMFVFWTLFVVNYFLMMRDVNAYISFPLSLPNEMLEIVLLSLAILDVKESHFERTANVMLLALMVWCGFCTLEVLNDTCGIGIDVGAWYTGARSMAFQLMYAFLVFTLYISTPRILVRYLFVWGALSLFAVFWVWKQQYIGFTHLEDIWLHTRGAATHLIYSGALTRYFSVYSDASNYGVGIASTAVAFIIFGITAKVRKYRYAFLLVGLACFWGIFPSGTRTAIACAIAGLASYIFLSKSVKIAVPFTILFAGFVFILAFTNIGNSNQQIRRMRSAFNPNDASANVRAINKQTMKKYMKEAPWGIGIAGYGHVPANNKYNLMSTIAADSEYVYIWLRTGVIGITTFLICNALILLGACWVVLFRLRSPSLRGIGAGFCCAFVSQQLGGYGNQVLMQFPNCLIFYGGISIAYVLPFIEQEWIEYENKLLAIQEEKKRLKLEKKRASRV